VVCACALGAPVAARAPAASVQKGDDLIKVCVSGPPRFNQDLLGSTPGNLGGIMAQLGYRADQCVRFDPAIVSHGKY
jgi:hypothetical protein